MMHQVNESIMLKINNMKKTLELYARSRLSEFIILEAHDGIYSEIKEQLLWFNRTIVTDDDKKVKVKLKMQILQKIEDFKELLRNNALEKDLQNRMLEFMKLAEAKNILHAITELSIVKNNGKNGRIDLVLVLKTPIGSQIIELKRVSVSILPRSKKDKSSSALKKAIAQIKKYGLSKICIKGWENCDLNESNQLLVMGKRLKLPGDYQFILEQEKESPKLKIYTWDGWISEFERIYT